MKKSALLILTIIALLALSCKKETISTNFDTSLKTWNSYKTNVNNSYRYTTKFQSFGGFTDSTRITVLNGKVTNRDYVRYKWDYSQNGSGPATKVVLAQWNETAADLGSNKQGFGVYTMDEIYAMAKNVWLTVDNEKNTIYFETKNDGIISTAGYVNKNCADDCFTGVTITSVTKL